MTKSKAIQAAAYIQAVEASQEAKRQKALEMAREWMAHNAGGDEWATRVRQALNEALVRDCGPK